MDATVKSLSEDIEPYCKAAALWCFQIESLKHLWVWTYKICKHTILIPLEFYSGKIAYFEVFAIMKFGGILKFGAILGNESENIGAILKF